MYILDTIITISTDIRIDISISIDISKNQSWHVGSELDDGSYERNIYQILKIVNQWVSHFDRKDKWKIENFPLYIHFFVSN